MSLRKTPEFEKGRAGEQIVSQLLQESGWYIVPSYDYCGEDDKSPRMKGENGFFVIPDLDASRQGKRLWFEVKTKSSATWTHKTQRHEHGIPLRHYRDYLRVQAESGTPVWLVVVEQDTGKTLTQSLDELSKQVRIYQGPKMSRGGMAFFPRDAFLSSRHAERLTSPGVAASKRKAPSSPQQDLQGGQARRAQGSRPGSRLPPADANKLRVTGGRLPSATPERAAGACSGRETGDSPARSERDSTT